MTSSKFSDFSSQAGRLLEDLSLTTSHKAGSVTRGLLVFFTPIIVSFNSQLWPVVKLVFFQP
jgi:hypothetical protein